MQGDLPGCWSMLAGRFSKECIPHKVQRDLWWTSYLMCDFAQGSLCCWCSTYTVVNDRVCLLLLDPLQGWHWWVAEAWKWRYWYGWFRFHTSASGSCWCHKAVSLWSCCDPVKQADGILATIFLASGRMQNRKAIHVVNIIIQCIP